MAQRVFWKNAAALLIAAVMAAVIVTAGFTVRCCAEDDKPVICYSAAEAGEALRAAMTERKDSAGICLVTDTPASETEELMGDIFDKALEHTGVPVEGDYLRAQYDDCSASAVTVDVKGRNAVLFTYAISYYDTAEQEDLTDDRVGEIIKELDLGGLSDYEKVNRIYRYVCENVEYDYDDLQDEEDKLKYTAYAALVEGKAVCQGYAAALYRLLLAAGIDNRIVFGTVTDMTGETGDHSWNIVSLDGKYYNTDVTSDDELGRWKFFLRGSESFDVDHVRTDEYAEKEFTDAHEISETDYQGRIILYGNAGIVFKKSFFIFMDMLERF